MSVLEQFEQMRSEGHAKEAAEWARDLEPILSESEARALLRALANEVLNPTKRHPNDTFTEGKLLPPDHGGQRRHVPHAEWVRQICLAVTHFGGKRTDAYIAVGKRFDTSEKNVERVFLAENKRRKAKDTSS